jgi:hypothetical protein
MRRVAEAIEIALDTVISEAEKMKEPLIIRTIG